MQSCRHSVGVLTVSVCVDIEGLVWVGFLGWEFLGVGPWEGGGSCFSQQFAGCINNMHDAIQQTSLPCVSVSGGLCSAFLKMPISFQNVGEF